MGMGDRWGAGQREGKRKRGWAGGPRRLQGRGGVCVVGRWGWGGKDERERKEEELVDIDERK